MTKHLHNYGSKKTYIGACLVCGKPDMWYVAPVKPKKKHSDSAPTLAEIQARLDGIKTPKGWTKIGVVIDESGDHALYFGKGAGDQREYQTISGLER